METKPEENYCLSCGRTRGHTDLCKRNVPKIFKELIGKSKPSKNYIEANVNRCLWLLNIDEEPISENEIVPIKIIRLKESLRTIIGEIVKKI